MAKWADPSERCREIARREREIYGQQELPDLLEHMATEADKLRAEAANSAAQRDEAIARAEVAEERLRAVGADLAGARALVKNLLRAVATSSGTAIFHCRISESLRAELARIRAADRTSITTEAKAND